MDEQIAPWFFDILPYRPRPFPDECVSGYLLRLAELNGFPALWSFTQWIFPSWDSPQAQAILRWEYPTAEWARLALYTHLTIEELNQLTVLPLAEKLGRAPTRMHPATRARLVHGLVNPSLRICPRCVEEQPYIRLMWRLLPVEVCLRHRCVLVDHCPHCHALLTAVGYGQQHLRCSHCRADLRDGPQAVTVAGRLLEEQSQRQADLAYLLNPGVSLVAGVPNSRTEVLTVAGAIGMKFRFLLDRVGQPMVAWARTTGISVEVLGCIHTGQPVPLHDYLRYLATFGISWPAFAALQVPNAFIEQFRTPAHLPLRVCPTPGCVHAQAPTAKGIQLLADIPDRRLARFRCMACGRNFTRTYDGQWVSRPSRRYTDPPPPKPRREVAQLKRMGLRGDSNRVIAEALGWDPQTVQHYWVALDMLDQVKRARATRRARARQQRTRQLRREADAALASLAQQAETITQSKVVQAMGYTHDILSNNPEVAVYISGAARQLNAALRARQCEAVRSRLEQVLADLPSRKAFTTLQDVGSEVGLSSRVIRSRYPDLYRALKAALKTRRYQRRQAHTRERLTQVDEAAKRLIARGERLSGPAIIQEAGFSRYAISSPGIRDAVRRWVGGFAPRD
jgi:hypothetical protein